MTMKSRLSRLEQTAGHNPARCWEADPNAGLWRDLDGGQAGGPLEVWEAHLATEAGGLLKLPGGKYLAGVGGAAL